MHRGKRIALVIPAYNEEKLLPRVLEAVPPVIDRVFVVDDASPDAQAAVVQKFSERDPRVKLLRHATNQGPGGGIITGYRHSLQEGYDITVVVGGDHQMNLSEVERFLDPIIDGRADYVKGNRFSVSLFESTAGKMPKVRFIGNWIITAITKIASGYYKVMDVVEGYTAISRHAIETVDWSRAWKKYGYPMDFLIRLNAYGMRVIEVPRTAIYLPGERQSQIKGMRYVLSVSPMLLWHFLWRLRFKYIYRDFHPLVFFYYMSFVFLPFGTLAGFAMAYNKLWGNGTWVTGPRAVLVALTLISGTQFFLFAMLFDMDAGK